MLLKYNKTSYPAARSHVAEPHSKHTNVKQIFFRINVTLYNPDLMDDIMEDLIKVHVAF